jgi:ribosomal protein S18 acetylase RimI-like enzyme
MRFRPATPADLDALEAIAVDCAPEAHGHAVPDAELEAWREGGARNAMAAVLDELIVAEDQENEGRALGLAHLTDHDLVNLLWVSPQARDRGVGSALLAHMEEKAFGAGRRQMRAFIPGNNPRLRAFFEKNGWKFYSERVVILHEDETAPESREDEAWEFIMIKRRPE